MSSLPRKVTRSLIRSVIKSTKRGIIYNDDGGTNPPNTDDWILDPAFAVNGTYPTLALCFKKNRYNVAGSSKLLTELGTYTRSYSGGTNAGSATIINSSGYIENTPINVIRQRHDPITNELQGIYLEGQSGNSIRASEDGNNADWTVWNTTKNNDVAVLNPTNQAGAWFLQENTATAGHEGYILTRAGGAGGNSVSAFFKAKGRTSVRLGMSNPTDGLYAWAILNLTTGAITSTGGSRIRGTPWVQAFKNGWYRLCVSGQAGSTKTESLHISLVTGTNTTSYAGDGASGVYVWGAQNHENQLITTSYIRSFNSAGSITRGADTFTIPDISEWYQTEGTFVVRALIDQTGLSRVRNLVSLDDGTVNNSINLSLNDNASDSLDADIINTGASVFSNSIGTFVQGNQAIIAVSFKDNDILAAANEQYGSLDTSGLIPALNRMLLGNGAGANTNGFCILQDVLFYPKRLYPVDVLSLAVPLNFDAMDAVV